jgi:DNA-binding NarL/FixJ family response regulator
MLAALDEAFERRGPPSLPDDRMSSTPSLRPSGVNETMTAEPVPLGTCAIVVAGDPGLRRSVFRSTTQNLKKLPEPVDVVSVATAAEAVTLLEASDCRLLLLDEESADGRLAELVALARGRGAEVIVISRDFQATSAALGSARVRHLVPKPVNVHVLTAVLGRVDLSGRASVPSSER